MPATQPGRWTRAEVHSLIEANPLQTPRYELVDGELLVTPGPSGPHQFIVRELLKALDGYLSRTSSGEALCSPFDVEVEAGSLTQPDIFVVPPEEAIRVDPDARLFERWRPGDEHPDVLRARLTWIPRGAERPFVLDLPAFFAKALGEGPVRTAAVDPS